MMNATHRTTTMDIQEENESKQNFSEDKRRKNFVAET